MTIQRMDHVGVVVDDLAAATEFFLELGLEQQGAGSVEGSWVDRIVGLDGIHAELVMLQTPDGHGRLELVKFLSPLAEDGDAHAPANAYGLRHVAFEVEHIDALVTGLRGRGAELVGELENYKDVYRARPRGHHRRAGGAARLTRPGRSVWIGGAACETQGCHSERQADGEPCD